MKPHSAVVYSSSMLLDILLNTQTHSLGTSLSNHPSPRGSTIHPSTTFMRKIWDMQNMNYNYFLGAKFLYSSICPALTHSIERSHSHLRSHSGV